MRYIAITGLLIAFVAAGIALLGVANALGQVRAVPVLTAPAGVNPGANAPVALVQQVQAADGEDDEMAKLHALDAQLGSQAESLVKQLADLADEPQRKEAKEKLHETLAQQFDAQQKVRELEVARIEAKVKKLRDQIAKRNEARRTIIEKRFDQLLSEAEGLGWNSPSGGSATYGNAFYLQQGKQGNYYAPAAGGGKR